MWIKCKRDSLLFFLIFLLLLIFYENDFCIKNYNYYYIKKKTTKNPEIRYFLGNITELSFQAFKISLIAVWLGSRDSKKEK